MSKTNQTLREKLYDRFREILIDPDRLEFGEKQVNLRVGGTADRLADQALKEISELLLECKPEKRNLYEAPTNSIENALIGYNSGIDDYEKNIKARLQ